ncbi:MAG: hypothetical protein R3B84_23430 [Zavarzinella sp.]
MWKKLIGCMTAFLVVVVVQAEEKSDLELKLVAKSPTVTVDLGGKTSEEYTKELQKDLDAAKKGDPVVLPAPLKVELELQVVNTSKKDVTIGVMGDVNQVNFTVKGPSVLTGSPLLAFTTDFRLPQEKTLKPGESYTMKIGSLVDGFRGASRMIYLTEAGKYTLSATFQLAEGEGKGPLLKSNTVELLVKTK